MEPWICPRCGAVWAGWVAKCNCHPPTTTASSTTITYVTCSTCGRLVQSGVVHQCIRRESTSGGRWPPEIIEHLKREFRGQG